MLRLCIALFTAFCLVACRTMQPLSSNAPTTVRAAVKVGSVVSVTAKNGKTYLLTLTEVDEEKFVGVGDGKKVTVRYDQVEAIEVRKVSAGRTAGLIGGVAAVVYVTAVVLVVLAFKAFGEGFGDAFGGDDEED